MRIKRGGVTYTGGFVPKTGVNQRGKKNKERHGHQGSKKGGLYKSVLLLKCQGLRHTQPGTVKRAANFEKSANPNGHSKVK